VREQRALEPRGTQAQKCLRLADVDHQALELDRLEDTATGARRFGISREAFRKRLLRNNVPIRRFGRLVYYDPRVLDAMLGGG
jgi:hypothetical protein